MRLGWPGPLVALVALAGCGGTPKDVGQLTLRDPSWDRVNIEVVITRRADCDSREEGFITSREMVMRKKETETFDLPNGATLCWRRDRDPANPAVGAWSGWTRGTVAPGRSAEADL
jgi:hypothetical protein